MVLFLSCEKITFRSQNAAVSDPMYLIKNTVSLKYFQKKKSTSSSVQLSITTAVLKILKS